jgi:hypothetical protein
MLFIHQRFTTYPIYFFYAVLLHGLGEFLLNLRVLELRNLLTYSGLHPGIPGV